MSVKTKTNDQLEFDGVGGQIRELKELKKNRKKVENAWRESEEKYRQIVDNSLDGLYIIQSLIFKFCNQRLAEIFGRQSYKELLEISIKDLIEPDSWELVEQQIKLRESGKKQVSHYEYQGVKKDGKIIELESLGSGITYQGKPAVQGTIRDITERKRVEDDLRTSEKRFRIFFESSPDAIYVLDMDGNILDVNLAACLLHGVGRTELVDKNMLEFFPPEYLEKITKDFPKWLTCEINYRETFIQADDGTSVPVEIRLRKIQYSQKVALMLYVRDISEQVQVGENYLESQRALSNFMSNLPGMAYRCLNDKGRTIKFVSQGCFNLTGYQPDDLIDNKTIAFEKLIHPDFQQYGREKIEQALEKKQTYHIEYRIITSEGKDKWVAEQGRGVFSDGNKLI
ncbi:MAG: PAS domain S-box protein, partial [Bacteroidales bacterium]|nr:PAS domain S-box protein [Bacteroidales bacterium]